MSGDRASHNADQGLRSRCREMKPCAVQPYHKKCAQSCRRLNNTQDPQEPVNHGYLPQFQVMGAGRKRKAAPWDKATGWKQVKVGDDLMLGSTEGGFMGLEVLEPEETLLFGHHKRQAQQAPDAEDEEMLAEVDEVASDKKPKKLAERPQSKKAKLSERGPTSPAVKGPARTSVEQQLNAKIAALEAENLALKAKNASKPDKLAGKDKEKVSDKAKQDKTARKDKEKVSKKAKQGKAAITDAAPVPAAAKASTTEQIDMSAWAEFDLHPHIAAAISQAGFTQPTPIQEQCLLPAIRDRRDVIGAAQTVCAPCIIISSTYVI